MLARSFLFESSSKLLVTRTGIKAWSSSNLVQIRQLILELLALEWRKFHTFELEYLWSEVANLDQILCVASLGWGKGCIRFWGWLTLARWTQVSDRCPLGYLFYEYFTMPFFNSGGNTKDVVCYGRNHPVLLATWNELIPQRTQCCWISTVIYPGFHYFHTQVIVLPQESKRAW